MAAVLVAVSPLLIGNLVETRFDMALAALLTWTLWAAVTERWRLAWGLLAAATLLKLVPLVLIPVLMPLAQAGEHAHHMPASDSLLLASLAVLVHSLAMLVTTGAVALSVYQWLGLDFLRRGWINLDLIWAAALILMGLWLLFA